MISFARSSIKSVSLETIYIFILTGLLLLSAFIKKGNDVLLINGNHTGFTDLFFSAITHLGEGAIFVIIIIVSLFRRFQYSIAIVAACVCNGLLVSLCKKVLFPDAPRPRNFLDPDLIHYVSGVVVHGNHSFPSGHTATAFCAAFLIWLISRNVFLGISTLTAALLVGYSRIYLAQHFLIDVSAGALIGVFSAYASWQMIAINKKPMWMNKKLTVSIKRKRKRAMLNLPA